MATCVCATCQVLLRFSQHFHSAIYLPGRLIGVRFSIKRTGFVFMLSSEVTCLLAGSPWLPYVFIFC